MNTESSDDDNGAVQDSDSSTSSTSDQPYDGMRPWARDLLRDDGTYYDYHPIFEKSGQTKFTISLMMPQSVDATPAALTNYSSRIRSWTPGLNIPMNMLQVD